jgi:hypothetical protein
MSTQLITIDSAACISFPRQEAAQLTHPGAPPEISRLADSDFFKGKSIAELAREQGVGPVKDISVFAGGIPDDEDVDELLAQLEELRGS